MSKTLFWDLFTCEGTYMIDWVGRGACDAVCCSVLQRVAVCWSVLQYVAIYCCVLRCVVVPYRMAHVLQCFAVCCSSVLQCGSCVMLELTRRNTLQQCCVAASVSSSCVLCCNVLQCVAMCCSVLQCVAVCCSVLQCVAVYCSVRPTQSIIYVPLQVNRFQKIILLIVQYNI